MMVAEKEAIALMKQKYGHNSIEVSCLKSLMDGDCGKTITVPERTLVVIDEADAAFIDQGYKTAEN